MHNLFVNLIVVDFEASGLISGSWPIEVGLARLSGDTLWSWSSLIYPEETWDPAAWSLDSEAIHGITRDTLEGAPSAAEVARIAARHLEGCLVVSDAPRYDEYWGRCLFETAGLNFPRLTDFDTVANNIAAGSLPILRQIYAALDCTDIPHRAGPDALLLLSALTAAQGKHGYKE